MTRRLLAFAAVAVLLGAALAAQRQAAHEGAPCVKGIQTNNVEVDDRGYVYAADRAGTGLHILELTGAARRIANFQ